MHYLLLKFKWLLKIVIEGASKLIQAITSSIRSIQPPEYEPANDYRGIFHIETTFKYNITTTSLGSCLVLGGASSLEEINALIPSVLSFIIVFLQPTLLKSYNSQLSKSIQLKSFHNVFLRYSSSSHSWPPIQLYFQQHRRMHPHHLLYPPSSIHIRPLPHRKRLPGLILQSPYILPNYPRNLLSNNRFLYRHVLRPHSWSNRIHRSRADAFQSLHPTALYDVCFSFCFLPFYRNMRGNFLT